MCSRTSVIALGGTRLYLCDIGFSSVTNILCSILSVNPISWSLQAKQSEYLVTRSSICRRSSGDSEGSSFIWLMSGLGRPLPCPNSLSPSKWLFSSGTEQESSAVDFAWTSFSSTLACPASLTKPMIHLAGSMTVSSVGFMTGIDIRPLLSVVNVGGTTMPARGGTSVGSTRTSQSNEASPAVASTVTVVRAGMTIEVRKVLAKRQRNLAFGGGIIKLAGSANCWSKFIPRRQGVCEGPGTSVTMMTASFTHCPPTTTSATR